MTFLATKFLCGLIVSRLSCKAFLSMLNKNLLFDAVAPEFWSWYFHLILLVFSRTGYNAHVRSLDDKAIMASLLCRMLRSVFGNLTCP